MSQPNEHSDWINQRSDAYLALRPVAVIQGEKAIQSPGSLFERSSLGVLTARDAWIFNSSGQKLRDLVEHQTAFYNTQVEVMRRGANTVARDPKQFKWDSAAERRARSEHQAKVRSSGFRPAVYRPFFRQHIYLDQVLNNSVHQIPTFFPTPGTRNPTILVERGLPTPGSHPGILAVDAIPENKASAGAGRLCQALPRYTYEQPMDVPQELLIQNEPRRRDNITDDALDSYRARYGEWVTKDQIFAYVYGILHSPEYRARYANDLARLLPRIPEVSTAEAFRGFSEGGQQLLDLHIGYEEAEPYRLEEQVAENPPGEPERYRVQKMRWGGTSKAPLLFDDCLQRLDHARRHSRRSS